MVSKHPWMCTDLGRNKRSHLIMLNFPPLSPLAQISQGVPWEDLKSRKKVAFHAWRYFIRFWDWHLIRLNSLQWPTWASGSLGPRERCSIVQRQRTLSPEHPHPPWSYQTSLIHDLVQFLSQWNPGLRNFPFSRTKRFSRSRVWFAYFEKYSEASLIWTLLTHNHSGCQKWMEWSLL